VPAAGLVPGDIVKLSVGAVVAADVRLTGGEILLDQSMLTGESIPIEAGPGLETYAGALVRRGEAVAEVTATGARTKFGRTAELVRTAHVESSQQKAVLRVARNLAMFNGVITVLLVGIAYALKLPLGEIIPLVLTAVLASAAWQAAASDLPKLSKFVPFDSATKMSEAMAVDPSGATVRAVKGAFAAVMGLTQPSPDASTTANQLEAQGFRVLAVAVGPPKALKLAGIIALSDPPRTDSAALIAELHKLGVRTVMVTGDAPATAAIVARAVGLDVPIASKAVSRNSFASTSSLE
jgi:magnesium-transporting ATPase (P-type)